MPSPFRLSNYAPSALLLSFTAHAAASADVDARIERITNDLMVKGSAQPASLKDRMRHHNIPGVSIALINANLPPQFGMRQGAILLHYFQ